VSTTDLGQAMLESLSKDRGSVEPKPEFGENEILKSMGHQN
jgi:hypothetical protein